MRKTFVHHIPDKLYPEQNPQIVTISKHTTQFKIAKELNTHFTEDKHSKQAHKKVCNINSH